MQKLIKKIGITTVAILVAFTGFATNVNASEKEIYYNQEQSLGIEVIRNISGEGIELQFKDIKSEDIDIENFVINDEKITDEKNKDYKYSYVVGENGNYKFTVEYSTIVRLKETNEEIKRSDKFSFDISVNEIKDKKSENVLLNENSGHEETQNVNEVREEVQEVNTDIVSDDEPKFSYYFPDSDSIEEFSISEVQAYSARSSYSVEVGEKILGSTNFYFASEPSYSFSFPNGFSEIWVNGRRAYCIEPSVMKVATGSATEVDLQNLNDIWVMQGRKSKQLSYDEKYKITLIANYGYDFPGHQNKKYSAAAQILIFEELGWVINTSTDVSYEKSEILRLVNSHLERPSWDGNEFEAKLGETLDLSDPLWNMFVIHSYSGLTILENSGNTLIVRIDSKDSKLIARKKGGLAEESSFIYSDGNSQKVGVFGIEDPLATYFTNTVKSHTQRVFKEGENGEPLSGHKFRMSYNNEADANGLLADGWDYVTGADGYTPTDTWNNEGQTVYVQEIEALDPYIRNTEIKTFVVTPGAETTISFKNEKAQGQFSINKYDNHGQRAIAKFNILNESNTVVGSVVTSLTGEVKSNILPLGKYKLQEISVNGNLVLNPEIIDVELKYKDQVTPVVLLSKDFVNNYQRGDINLTKIEDTSDKFNPEYHGTKLEGIEFGLVAKADTYEGSTLVYRAGEIIGKEVTNSVGQLKFHNVAIGEYALRELKTIEGYQLLDHDVDVSIAYDSTNNTVEITQINKTVENSPILGSVELVKANGTGNQRLEGGVFDLYRGDKKLETYTSDKNGRIVVEGLRYSTGNTYKFIETKAPGGYWLNAEPIYFDVTEQGETVYLIAPNNLIEVHVESNKTNEDGLPLEGVGFKIRNTDTNEFVTISHADGKEVIDENTWFTGKDGSVFIKGKMTAGNYELVEVAPLEGYQPIAPVKFTIDDQQTYIDLGTLVGLSLDVGEIVNYWNRGNIKVGKIDEDTKEFLQGFGFNVYNAKGEFIGYHETGADGTFTLEDVRYGLYTIEEVKVNGDYGIDSTKNKQEIFVEEHGKTYELTFENKHADIKTSASFVERDKETPNIVTITDKVSYTNLWVGKEYTVEGFLMIKETNQPLLIDGQRVTGSTTFTPTQKDGFVNVDFTFDQNALNGQTVVVFETLKREAIEVVVHHDINDIEQTPEIPEIGTTLTYTERDKQTPNIVTLTDEVRYTGLVIGKEYTVKGQLQDGVTGLPLLIDGKTVDGQTTFIAEQKDGIVNVKFVFDQNKLMTERIVAFEKLEQGERLIAVHADLEDKDQTLEIITIRMNKKDSISFKPLVGAEFTMFDLEGNALEVKLTDESGIAEFKIIEGETVELKETKAPEGYLLSDEVIRVTGSKEIDGNLYTVEYLNDLLPIVILPSTGVDTPVFPLVAIAMIIIGFYLVLRNKNIYKAGLSSSENVLFSGTTLTGKEIKGTTVSKSTSKGNTQKNQPGDFVKTFDKRTEQSSMRKRRNKFKGK
ncbi:SpaA isopeptide-forming pilin-related protein [Erysipelothrix rhusiopathiae]|nr:SpaA isopeptide-forming pilin-related protein [Erysipelothrix rhusiopathiae]MDE8269069.1 SpaA isopeptide-forming pilin-related protein [Erysipelothrix rhusiopathiae]MDE8270662.1 SpaA isopeptide-forming pilin-related protein [Erysipelothrix rhusiopathiae]MDE8279087.1 SpaA isopeptide-forming pilin-related protein [Erysipelothrix rhusiopathiae]MDE8319427.1 SpaA isopeptide-forming pilin-related protein [Erysipelothrix rhusiopathiae]